MLITVLIVQKKKQEEENKKTCVCIHLGGRTCTVWNAKKKQGGWDGVSRGNTMVGGRPYADEATVTYSNKQ